MVDLDIDPFFAFDKAYTKDDLPHKELFERTTDDKLRLRDRVTPCSGEHTIEFFMRLPISNSKQCKNC